MLVRPNLNPNPNSNPNLKNLTLATLTLTLAALTLIITLTLNRTLNLTLTKKAERRGGWDPKPLFLVMDAFRVVPALGQEGSASRNGKQEATNRRSQTLETFCCWLIMKSGAECKDIYRGKHPA